MKKTFSLIDSKRNADRVADQIKFEVKKYLKRERNKKLPEKFDFWGFDCRFGDTKVDAKEIDVSKINESITRAATDNKEGFYLEILAKPMKTT